jgi:drug/metabolite transporter (DMT)-like permease
MQCYYSPKIIGILVSMIVTGAARSVAVKIFYQRGFVNPLFVTLLYLLGHAMALLVYGGSRYVERQKQQRPNNDRHSRHTLNSMISKSIHRTSLHDHLIFTATVAGHYGGGLHSTATLSEENSETGRPMVVSFWGMLPMGEFPRGRYVTTPNGNHIEMMMDTQHQPQPAKTTTSTTDGTSNNTQATQWGSVAGLNENSKRAVQWVHAIPWYGKPVVPGLCNMGKSALRWASLVYIDASVAEILISGLELVLSVIAARLIRKRLVAHLRWLGVALVLVGIVWVGLTDYMVQLLATNNDNTSQAAPAGTTAPSSSSSSVATSSSNNNNDTLKGLLLILAQSIMSAIQDIAEEIFMSEADFPATLLLGMEGLLGFVLGALLYVPVAPLLHEDPVGAWRHFTSSSSVWGYGMFLVLLFLVNGIANILTTCATSSMTRNVWKNIRTALVWVLGLLTFYIAAARSSGESSRSSIIGEAWETPKSFITLLGFCIMLAGIHTYYRPAVVPNQHNATASSTILHDERYDEIYLDQPQLNLPERATTTHCWDLPVLSNNLTTGSLMTEVHDNTIRQRSLSLPGNPRLMASELYDHNWRTSLSSSPKFEIHAKGGSDARRCGRLHTP